MPKRLRIKSILRRFKYPQRQLGDLSSPAYKGMRSLDPNTSDGSRRIRSGPAYASVIDRWHYLGTHALETSATLNRIGSFTNYRSCPSIRWDLNNPPTSVGRYL